MSQRLPGTAEAAVYTGTKRLAHRKLPSDLSHSRFLRSSVSACFWSSATRRLFLPIFPRKQDDPTNTFPAIYAYLLLHPQISFLTSRERFPLIKV